MIKKWIAVLVLSFFCLKANAQSSHDNLTQAFYKMTAMGIIPPLGYDSVCAKLQLRNIGAVADSFYLRLWIGSMFGNGVMILEKKEGRWKIEQYSYHNENELKSEPWTKKITADEMILKLAKVYFEGMITQSEIPGFKDNVDDGIMLTLEVKFAGGSKTVQYHSPGEFSDQYNKAFNELLDILQL